MSITDRDEPMQVHQMLDEALSELRSVNAHLEAVLAEVEASCQRPAATLLESHLAYTQAHLPRDAQAAILCSACSGLEGSRPCPLPNERRAGCMRVQAAEVTEAMIEAGKDERMHCFGDPTLDVGTALTRIYRAMVAAQAASAEPVCRRCGATVVREECYAGWCSPSPSATPPGERPAAPAQKPFAWFTVDDITDRDGTPIGRDEPRFSWGEEPPEEYGWSPLYLEVAAPAQAAVTDEAQNSEVDKLADLIASIPTLRAQDQPTAARWAVDHLRRIAGVREGGNG
jgi:hypothetical protein